MGRICICRIGIRVERSVGRDSAWDRCLCVELCGRGRSLEEWFRDVYSSENDVPQRKRR